MRFRKPDVRQFVPVLTAQNPLGCLNLMPNLALFVPALQCAKRRTRLGDLLPMLDMFNLITV